MEADDVVQDDEDVEGSERNAYKTSKKSKYINEERQPLEHGRIRRRRT